MGESPDESAVVVLVMVTSTGAVGAAQDKSDFTAAKGGGDAERGRVASELRVIRMWHRYAHEHPAQSASYKALPLGDMQGVLEQCCTRWLGRARKKLLHLIHPHMAEQPLDHKDRTVENAHTGSLQGTLLWRGKNEARCCPT